jgi:hypothetical protein
MFLYIAVTGATELEKVPFLVDPELVVVVAVAGQYRSSTVPPYTVQASVLHHDCCVHEKSGVLQGGRGTKVETTSNLSSLRVMVIVLVLVVITGPSA